MKHEHVEQHLARGFKVFPLQGKLPLTGSRGYKDATVDPEAIQHWIDYPDLNIGVVAPDDVVAIDIDPKNGASIVGLTEVVGDLPATYTVNTSRGADSVHLFYRVPTLEGLKATPLPGVDVKHARNGYTVGAGSIHPDTGGEYVVIDDSPIADAPAPLVELITKPAKWSPFYKGKRKPSHLESGSSEGQTSKSGLHSPSRAWANRMLADCVAELATASEGGRNQTMNRLCFYVGTLAGAGLLDTERVIEQMTVAAETCGLDPFEIDKTVARSVREGMLDPWQQQIAPEIGEGDEEASPGITAEPSDCMDPEPLSPEPLGASPQTLRTVNSPRDLYISPISGAIKSKGLVRSIYEGFVDGLEGPAQRWQANALDLKVGVRDETARKLAVRLAKMVTITDGDDPLCEPIATTMGDLIRAMGLDPKVGLDRKAVKDTALPSLERSGLIVKQAVGKGRSARILIWLKRTAPDAAERADTPSQGFVRTTSQDALFDLVQAFLADANIADFRTAAEHYGLSRVGPDELIIQGPAGSGKTTVAAQAMLAAGLPYIASGFTNRCVDVQKRKGLEGRTIHSLAFGMTPEGDWVPVSRKMIEARMNYAVILVDESSMLDDSLYEAIRQCANKIIFVGDPGQLDPIFGTPFWKDRVPDFVLDRSMRFEDGSEIGRLAKRLWCTPFDPTILADSAAWVDGPINWSDWDTAVCYRNETRWRLNIGFMSGAWRAPQPGDPVMIRYNIPVESVYNRQMFTVVESRGIKVLKGHEVYDMTLEDAEGNHFDKRLLAQGFEDAVGEDAAVATEGVSLGGNRWAIPATFGFAHTAHSAQGGEWGRVLVVDESFPLSQGTSDPFVANKFLYTAITRAQSHLGLTSLSTLLTT